jgi:hypothetical protein
MLFTDLSRNILTIFIGNWIHIFDACFLDSAFCNHLQRDQFINALTFALSIKVRENSIPSLFFNQVVLWILLVKNDHSLSDILDQKISEGHSFINNDLIFQFVSCPALKTHTSILSIDLCGVSDLNDGFLVVICASCPCVRHLFFDTFIKPTEDIKDILFNDLLTFSAKYQNTETMLSLLLQQNSVFLTTLCLTDGVDEKPVKTRITSKFAQLISSYKSIDKLVIRSNKCLLTDESLGCICDHGHQITYLDISNGGKFTDPVISSLCKYLLNLKVLILNDCKTISFESFVSIYNFCRTLEHIEFNQCWKPPNIVFSLLLDKFSVIHSLDMFRCKFTGIPASSLNVNTIQVSDFNKLQIPKHDKKAFVFHSFTNSFCDKLYGSQLMIHCLTIGRDCIIGDQLCNIISLCQNFLKSFTLFHSTKVSSGAIEYIARKCKILQSIDLKYCDFVSYDAIRSLLVSNPNLREFTLVVGNNCFVTDGFCCVLGYYCPCLEKIVLQDFSISLDSLESLSRNCPHLKHLCLWPDSSISLNEKALRKAMRAGINLEVCVLQKTSTRSGY